MNTIGGKDIVSINNNNILAEVKKHVRFNQTETNSLPIIQENAVLPTINSASLSPTLVQNPVEHRMELSICEAVMKQQHLEEQQRRLQENQRNSRPMFAELYQQAGLTNFLQQSGGRSENTPMHAQCTCQMHSCVPQTSNSPLTTSVQSLPSHLTTSDTSRSHEIRTEALEKRVESLQEQLFLLQQQMSYILSLQSSPKVSSPMKNNQSSNPFLSTLLEEENTKCQMTNSSTQTTFIERPDPNPQKSQSDKTFFNQVLGQVNQILDNTEESRHAESCKLIDSDTSSVSILEPNNNPQPEKKSTDKSSVMDSLAAKYLANQTGNTSGQTTQDTIDVSTTCYNYMKKYDLLQKYGETTSEDMLDEKLLKSSKFKIL